MTTEEARLQALQCAVGHRLASEDAATVVKNAEQYFAFLVPKEPLRELGDNGS